MSRLSVVMPCFESAPWLREALGSLAQQTRLPDEVVIADDGSSGAPTLALLDRLAREGCSGLRELRVLREKHRGPGATRNAAVRACTGELILPLDADDALQPRALEKLEAALQAEPGAAFAFPHVTHFGSLRAEAVAPRFNPYLQLEDNKLVVTALLRREVFTEHGAWYSEEDGYEDWSFWLSVAERGLTGVAVEEALFRYRRKGSAGQLATDTARRDQLKAALRLRHPFSYSSESRAQLKQRFAPGLEIIWPAALDDERLSTFLRGQSFDDLCVTAQGALDARALLSQARGKHLLLLEPPHLPLLATAPPGFLEQLVRCLEAHAAFDVLLVPVEIATLQAHLTRPRLAPCPPSPLADHTRDLLLLRTARAPGRASLAVGTGVRALAAPALRHGRGLLFAEDFFGLCDPGSAHAIEISPAPHKARRTLAQAAWSSTRRSAERLFGAERVGDALRPLRQELAALARTSEALGDALRAGRLPLSLEARLPESLEMERRLLDAEPVRFDRHAPFPLAAGKQRVLLLMPSLQRTEAALAALELASSLPRDRVELICATSREATHELSPRLRALCADLMLYGETTAAGDQPAAVLQLLRDRQVETLAICDSWLGLQVARAAKALLPRLRTIAVLLSDSQIPGDDFAKASCQRFDEFIDSYRVAHGALRERCLAWGVKPDKLRPAGDDF